MQTAVVSTGTQALQVTLAANEEAYWFAPTTGVLTSSDSYVDISWDMSVSHTTLDSDSFGPFMGLSAYQDDTGAGDSGLFGSLGVDAATGDVLYQVSTNGGELTETGTQVSFDTWNNFRIHLDFVTDTYTIYLNGSALVSSIAFVDSGLTTFTDADVTAIAANSDAISQAATGTAYFDNLIVQLESNVIKDETTTSLVASAASTTYGDTLTFTATVAAVGAGTPTGSVTFMDGATTLGTVAVAANGIAAFTSTSLIAGAHSVTAIYSGDTEFNTSTSTAVSPTVTPAVLTVTANNASRLYGDANPTFTSTITGFKNSETLATSGVTGAAALSTTAAAASPVASYAITAAAGTLAASNYTFVFSNGTLAVNKATLTVTTQNASRIYGNANPTFTSTMTGFKNSETLATSGVTGSAALSTTATTSSGVGSYSITGAIGTLAAGNYAFSFVNSGVLTIQKATLTVTANNASRSYGAANPTFTSTITGFKNSETLATSGVAGSAT